MEIDPRIVLHIGTLVFATGLAWGVSKRANDENERTHVDMWKQIDKSRTAIAEHNTDSQNKRIEFERRIADVAMCAKRSEDRYDEMRAQLSKISEKLDRLIEGRFGGPQQ